MTRDERGAVAVEFAILGGAVLVAFFSLVAFAGRVQQQENAIRVAAHNAARAASLSETKVEAIAAAERAAVANLAQRDETCVNPSVAVNFEHMGAGSTFDLVSVTVTCTTGIDSRQVSASHTAVEVVDVYRGEQ